MSLIDNTRTKVVIMSNSKSGLNELNNGLLRPLGTCTCTFVQVRICGSLVTATQHKNFEETEHILTASKPFEATFKNENCNPIKTSKTNERKTIKVTFENE